jgi:protein-S-isoprenylcysteine O-methyltransferase Ste14
MPPFHIFWLIGYLFYLFGVYGRSARRYRKLSLSQARSRPLDVALDMITFVGWQVVPLVYIFSSWLEYADYTLPAWSSWIGAGLFVLALSVLWKAYTDLGANWSPKLDILQEHTLITQGIYARLRHPIYAGLMIWMIAQPLLLHNWLAGFGLLVTYLPLIIIRVPREEQMMLEAFGESYRAYMARTGRYLPK